MHVLRLMPQYDNMHAWREEKQGLEAGLQTKQAFRVTFLTRGNGLEKGKSECVPLRWGTANVGDRAVFC